MNNPTPDLPDDLCVEAARLILQNLQEQLPDPELGKPLLIYHVTFYPEEEYININFEPAPLKLDFDALTVVTSATKTATVAFRCYKITVVCYAGDQEMQLAIANTLSNVVQSREACTHFIFLPPAPEDTDPEFLDNAHPAFSLN